MEEKPNYYAIIPANVRYDENLRANEKLLYGEITALSEKNGKCWASNNYFAKLYNVSPQAISKWVQALEKQKYITIEYEKEGKSIVKRIIKLVSTDVDRVSTTVDRGINKCLGGYQQKFKENNTSINNTSINNIYIVEIVDYLNEKTNSKYKAKTNSTVSKINARLKEGYTVEDFKNVIDKKTNEWLGTEMERYLRPETLFGSKFESYVNQNIIEKEHKETRYEKEQRIMKEWLEKND